MSGDAPSGSLPAPLQAFLQRYLGPDDLAGLAEILSATEPNDIAQAVKRHGQETCTALAVMLRQVAGVAPSDASFMIGYDPLIMRTTEVQDKKTPEQKELEWWQELMGFLFVGTFARRGEGVIEIHGAIKFRDELIDHLGLFPTVLEPRLRFWQRVKDGKRGTVGFRSAEE